MTDQEFLRASFDLSLDYSAFHHRDHLRLAWLVVQSEGPVAAEETVAAGVRRYAAAHGHGPRGREAGLVLRHDRLGGLLHEYVREASLTPDATS